MRFSRARSHRKRPFARATPRINSGRTRRLGIELLESRRVLNAGDLDPTFGNGGKVTTNIGVPFTNADTFDSATAVAIQPDGKIIAVGNTALNRTTNGNGDFALVRYNADGSIDGSFGIFGKVDTDVGGSQNDFAKAVALQSDGKIVVAGTVQYQATSPLLHDPLTLSDFVTVRYNANGTLDQSFGNGGIVRTHFLTTDPNSVAQGIVGGLVVQPDGRIVVAGEYDEFTDEQNGQVQGESDHGEAALVRYNSDGTLDGTFGNGGLVITDVSGTFPPAQTDFQPAGIVLQSDGKLVIAGTAEPQNAGNQEFAILRFSPNGSLDNSFGNGGVAFADFEPDTFAIPQGSHESASSIALQPDGKLLVAGSGNNEGDTTKADILSARFTTNGSLDASFGTGGMVYTNTTTFVLNPPSHINNWDFASSVAVQPDGKILLGGTIDPNYDTNTFSFNVSSNFALLRYNQDGSLDTSFGSGTGIAFYDFASSSDEANAMAIAPDGRIVEAGQTINSNFVTDFALVRVQGDPQTIVQLSGNDLVVTDARPGGKNDRLKLSDVGGKLEIQDLNGTYITALVGTGDGTATVDVDPSSFSGQVIVNSLDGDDYLLVDSSFEALGKNLDDNGGNGSNTLSVLGSGANTAVFTPSGATLQNGVLLVDGGLTVTTTSVGTVDLSYFGNASTVGLPVATNNVRLLQGAGGSDGTLRGLLVQMLSTNINFAGDTTDTIDTSAATGPNVISTFATLVAALNIDNLVLKTSAIGAVDFGLAVAVAGALEVDSPTVTLNGLLAFSSETCAATTVNVGPSGSIQQGLLLAAPVAAVNVSPGTYAGDVSTAGKSIRLSPGPVNGAVNINGNLTLDSDDTVALEIDGGSAGKFGHFAVSGMVTLGGAQLALSGSYRPLANLELIANNSTSPVSGTFSDPFAMDGAAVTINGEPMYLFYDRGDGNDVVLVDSVQLVLSLASRAVPPSPSASASGTSGLASDSSIADSQYSLSADGRYVVFVSNAPNLVSGVNVSTAFNNVYRYDRVTGEVDLVSISSDGQSGGNGESENPVISADGNIVAFQSSSTNLDPLATDSNINTFARNISAGTTTLVSVDFAGTAGGDAPSIDPVISADGNVVAYTSWANNLSPLATDSSIANVFARNLATGTSYLVSVNNDGNSSGDANSGAAGAPYSPTIAIDADGSVVAFVSSATNLTPQLIINTNPPYNIFAHNLTTGSTYLVSIDTTRTTGGNGYSSYPSISADGGVVAFESYATNLQPLPTSSHVISVYAYSSVTGTMNLVSVNKDGTGSGDSNSFEPVISADGSTVAFTSDADNLSPLASGGDNRDIFARNLATSTTYLVSVNLSGTGGGDQFFTRFPSISANGQIVAFESNANNLPPSLTASAGDVVVRDLLAGTTRLVSIDQNGMANGNAPSLPIGLSADGSTVAFISDASDLVAHDLNGHTDVFLAQFVETAPVTNAADAGAGTLRQALQNLTGAPGAAHSVQLALPPGGQTINLLSPLPVVTNPLILSLDPTQNVTIASASPTAWTNNSTLTLTGGGQLTVVGGVEGMGDLTVDAGSRLAVGHIAQNALIIGGTASSPAVMTIAASDAAGNPLAAASSNNIQLSAVHVQQSASNSQQAKSAQTAMAPAISSAGINSPNESAREGANRRDASVLQLLAAAIDSFFAENAAICLPASTEHSAYDEKSESVKTSVPSLSVLAPHGGFSIGGDWLSADDEARVDTILADSNDTAPLDDSLLELLAGAAHWR
jgi:uncharacterized delta-60 repeat protein